MDISGFRENAQVISALVAVISLLVLILNKLQIIDKLRSIWARWQFQRPWKPIQPAPKSPIVIADPNIIESPLCDGYSNTIKFGVMPYIDHTYAVIADRFGWFSDLGIEVSFIPLTPETIIKALEDGDIDIATCVPSNIIERGKNQKRIKAFAMGSIFQGYALMGRRRYRYFPFFRFVTYQKLREKGFDHLSAIKVIDRQLRRKRITFSKDIGILPFLRHILSIGGLNFDRDIVYVEAPENETLRRLRERKVHLQIGGVPSRIMLEREGYQPIITSKDIMSKDGMKNSPFLEKNDDYLAILQTAWFATEETINRERNLILRLASLNFRLIRFIINNPGYAAQIQAPYLNKITNIEITDNEIEHSYKYYHQFYEFTEQRIWFTKKNSPFYVPKVTMKFIEHWKQYSIEAFDINGPEDILVAGDIYQDLLDLKSSCKNLVKEVEDENLSEVSQLVLRSAKKHFKNYNFLDSNLLLESLKANRNTTKPI